VSLPAPQGRLRVAVDASALRAGRTGIGCYVEHLLVALPAEGVQVLSFSNRPVDGHPEAAVRRLRPTAAWLALLADRQANRLRPDVVHFPTGRAPRRTATPMVVTIHDLSPLQAASGLRRRERWLTAPGLRRGIREADALIAVSADTARALVAAFPSTASRTVVIPEGPTLAPGDPAEPAASLRRRLDLPDLAPVWLHVGASEPRKQLPQLVEAHAMAVNALRRAGAIDAALPVLVLVGPAGGDASRLRDTVARLALTPWVRCPGLLSRSALSGLHRMAELYVTVSLHEGFGLAVLDAMGFGLPVLSSGRGALGELAAGDAAWVLGDTAPAVVAAELLELHDRPLLRRALGQAARTRAAAYNWQRTALATADLYRSVAARRRATVNSQGAVWPR